MKKLFLAAIATLATTYVSTSASALTVNLTVPNFSFENDTNGSPDPVSNGNFLIVAPGGTGMTGWTTSDAHGDTGTLLASDGYESGVLGNRYAFINFDNTVGGGTGTITSGSLGVTIAPLETYTLTVAVGNPVAADSARFGSPGPVGLELLANNAVAGSTTVLSTQTTNGTFTDFSATFTTAASGGFIGDNLTIELTASEANNGTAIQASFDDVQLTETAVPEPAVWTMLLAGFAFMLALNRARLRV